MAAVSAALAVAIGVLSLPGPQASAGELRDKQKHAHRQVEKADEALEESSAALRRATRALSRTREELVEARAELGDVRARLQIAQQQDEEMKVALAAAEARLAQAQADVAAGKTALTTQQELVVDTITDIYEQGDPSLLAFTSILNAQTPSDITRQREANSSLILRQDNEYDDLRAAEVLLKVHENEVQEATAEVVGRDAHVDPRVAHLGNRLDVVEVAVRREHAAHAGGAGDLEQQLVLVGGVDDHRFTRALASQHEHVVLERPDDHLLDAHVGSLVVRQAGHDHAPRLQR